MKAEADNKSSIMDIAENESHLQSDSSLNSSIDQNNVQNLFGNLSDEDEVSLYLKQKLQRSNTNHSQSM